MLRTLSLVIALLGLSAAMPVPAAEAPPATDVAATERTTLTVDEIRRQIAELENAQGLDETLRNRLLELYRQAAEHLHSAEEYRSTAKTLGETVREAPQLVPSLNQKLEQISPPSPEAMATYEQASLSELKQALAREKGELAALESRLAELDSDVRALRGRPPRAREELDQAKQRLSAVEFELQQAPAADEDPRLHQARTAALATERQALKQQIALLEQELLSQDARLAVAEARRALLARQTEVQSERVQHLQSLANAASRAEAAAAASSAARAAEALASEFPALGEAAGVNAQLSRQLDALVNDIEEVNARQREISKHLTSVRTAFSNTRQQLEIAGLSEALGEALRNERIQLPSPRNVAERAEERGDQMAEASLRQFQLAQGDSDIELKAQVEAVLGALPPDASEELENQVREVLRSLQRDRRELKEKLAINYGRYVDGLADLARDERELTQQIEQYRELLDEHLFWIASASPAGPGWIRDIIASIGWLLDPGLWAQRVKDLINGFLAAPVPPLAGVLGVLLLVRGRPRFRDTLDASRATIGDPVFDRFTSTLQALLATLLLALPYPALIAIVAWILTVPEAASPAGEAAGLALRAVAGVAFALECFRQLCRPGGIGETHLRWGFHACRVLRRNLTWLLIASLPAAFIIGLTETSTEELHRNGLGRLVFALMSIALAVFAHRVLHPERGIWREPDGLPWGGRLRRIAHPISVCAPLLLGGLALSGYYYTALQLESRLFSTGGLIVGAALLISLILRAIRVAERQLTQRRLTREVSRELEQRDETADARQPRRPRGAEPDMRMVDEHTRSLLRVVAGAAIAVGLWIIWSDLLPALNLFNDVVLWQQTGAEGEVVFAVTLIDVCTALLLIGITMLAARNLPGVLEITLLSRLAVDPGNRYAITAISRYFIVGVGLIWALGLIGVSWGQAQWLIAALGVGLGFGLQEIFANFISGLILLFERPIRVGDTVTVGEQSGTVSRIRIRATTITDWDRKELVIPNKMFITDRLINWTLTDAITRIVIQMNVAYGTDPQRLSDIVLELARANPRVLEDPEPALFFSEFVPGALRFQLHVYVKELADRLPVRHQLLEAMQEAFHKEGIDLPYPQQDVHIRTLPEGLRGSGEGSSA